MSDDTQPILVENFEPAGAHAAPVQSQPQVQIMPMYIDEPRRTDITVARIDAWSVLKVGFLVSIALSIAIVVGSIVLWFVLDGMNVFSSIEDFLVELNAERFLTLMEYVRLPRVISYSIILGVANVVIFTAVSALIALLYNMIAALVGGIRVSLLDE